MTGSQAALFASGKAWVFGFPTTSQLRSVAAGIAANMLGCHHFNIIIDPRDLERKKSLPSSIVTTLAHEALAITTS